MHREGFTLIEMIVVLFILSILAALATPSVTGTILSARLRASAAEVRATFANARSLAVISGRERAVFFDLEKGEYGLDNDVVRRGFPEPVRLGRVRIGERDKKNEEETVAVHFYPDGTAEEAEVVVDSGDGRSIRVMLDPLTGLSEARL